MTKPIIRSGAGLFGAIRKRADARRDRGRRETDAAPLRGVVEARPEPPALADKYRPAGMPDRGQPIP